MPDPFSRDRDRDKDEDVSRVVRPDNRLMVDTGVPDPAVLDRLVDAATKAAGGLVCPDISRGLQAMDAFRDRVAPVAAGLDQLRATRDQLQAQLRSSAELFVPIHASGFNERDRAVAEHLNSVTDRAGNRIVDAADRTQRDLEGATAAGLSHGELKAIADRGIDAMQRELDTALAKVSELSEHVSAVAKARERSAGMGLVFQWDSGARVEKVDRGQVTIAVAKGASARGVSEIPGGGHVALTVRVAKDGSVKWTGNIEGRNIELESSESTGEAFSASIVRNDGTSSERRRNSRQHEVTATDKAQVSVALPGGLGSVRAGMEQAVADSSTDARDHGRDTPIVDRIPIDVVVTIEDRERERP